MRAKAKLVGQIAVAVGMWLAGFHIDAIANPFGPPLPLGPLAAPITIFWIIGVTNAINLIDGLDGLAGGVALTALAAVFSLAWRADAVLMVVVLAAVGGAVFGFLRYNFNPASIFLGDSGSLFLGFILATVPILSLPAADGGAALLVPLVALGLPVGDTLLAITRRAARGQLIFSADRSHVHHRILDLGLSHRDTVLALYGLSTVLAGVAIGLARADGVQALSFAGALVGMAVLFLALTDYIKPGKMEWIRTVRGRNLARRAVVRSAAERLRLAQGPDHVAEVVAEVAQALGAHTAKLGLAGAGRSEWTFGPAETAPRELLLVKTYQIYNDRPEYGVLELAWSDGRRVVDRDSEIAIETLCDHLRDAISRLGLDRTRQSHSSAPALTPAPAGVLAPVPAPASSPVRAREAHEARDEETSPAH